MMPKIIAPTGRIASVAVRAKAMSGRDRPNAVATSSMISVRMKKSNASRVQPRNPARTALRWLMRLSRVMGRAAG